MAQRSHLVRAAAESGLFFIVLMLCMPSREATAFPIREIEDGESMTVFAVSGPGQPGSVQRYGHLQVIGNALCDERGNPVQLRGMSTAGLQWHGSIVNRPAFEALAWDWGVDVIRLALYVGEDGYASRPSLKDTLHRGVALCIELGLYVIIDWHVLTPGDPRDSVYDGAADFFREMAETYAHYPNIIYEIMNEPNGDLEWSRDLKPYAQQMVDVIRSHDSRNLILIGSGNWSQEPHLAAADPVSGENLAYTLHFYSGTHGSTLRENIEKALDLGVAVFVSEWGTSQANGDGGLFLEEAADWLDFLDRKAISWVNWSLSSHDSSSAALNPGTLPVPMAATSDGVSFWPEVSLSPSGRWVRQRLRSYHGF